MPATQDSIALIEWHDARVAAFQVQMGGQVDLEIAHIVVFHEIEKENYDVWSYAARLNLQGVSHFEVIGELAKDDSVFDAKLTDATGAEVTWQQLTNGAPVDRIGLELSSGAKVNLACAAGQLSLVKRVRFLEKWSGPLTTPGS